MQIDAPFIVNTVEGPPGRWAGHVCVDGLRLLTCTTVDSQPGAVTAARAAFGHHMQMLFAGSGDAEHQEQTKRYAEQVELSAAIVLRGAAACELERAEVRDGNIYATFRRAWGAAPTAG